MQDMVESIRASRVPVVVYITPRGLWQAAQHPHHAGRACLCHGTRDGDRRRQPGGSQGEDLGETIEARRRISSKPRSARLPSAAVNGLWRWQRAPSNRRSGFS